MVGLAALSAAGAVLLLVAPRPKVPDLRAPAPPDGWTTATVPDDGLLRRWRWAWALLAGSGAGAFVGGGATVPVGLVTGAAVAALAGRVEPRATRLRREEVRRDLPHLVALLGAALRAGAPPATAIDLVGQALPGAAAEVLAPAAARLALGADPATVWAALAADPVVGPLGRALERAHRAGAPVAAAVDRLSVDLARSARAEVEDRARAVGVRAAVPLGICLLPAFLLLGIVPLVAGLARSLAG